MRILCQDEKMKENQFEGQTKKETSHQTDLLGKVIQQGVEAFEAAFVHRHPDASKLAVATFVEGDPFGRGRRGHMCRPWIGFRWSGEGRGMFRRGLGVPHPRLD